MTQTFMTTDQRYRAPYLDVPTLAAALAPLIGGVVMPPAEPETGMYAGAVIYVRQDDVTPTLCLHLRSDHKDKNPRLIIAATHRSHSALEGRTSPDFPSITVDPTRPLDKIGSDVKKRIVDASAEPLQKLKAKVEEARNQKSAVLDHSLALRAAFPDIEISPPRDNYAAVRFKSPEDVYVLGSLGPTSFRVDRIGNLSPARLKLVLEALTKPL